MQDQTMQMVQLELERRVYILVRHLMPGTPPVSVHPAEARPIIEPEERASFSPTILFVPCLMLPWGLRSRPRSEGRAAFGCRAGSWSYAIQFCCGYIRCAVSSTRRLVTAPAFSGSWGSWGPWPENYVHWSLSPIRGCVLQMDISRQLGRQARPAGRGPEDAPVLLLLIGLIFQPVSVVSTPSLSFVQRAIWPL